MTNWLVLLALITACGGKKAAPNTPPPTVGSGSATPVTETPPPVTDGSGATGATQTSFTSVADLAKAFDADPTLEGKTVDVKMRGLGQRPLTMNQHNIDKAVHWAVVLNDDMTKRDTVSVLCRIKDADKEAAKAAAVNGLVARGKLTRLKKGAFPNTPLLEDCAISAAP